MSELIKVITDPQEVREKKIKAREAFEKEVIRNYGYMVFSEEYLERQWSS